MRDGQWMATSVDGSSAVLTAEALRAVFARMEEQMTARAEARAERCRAFADWRASLPEAVRDDWSVTLVGEVVYGGHPIHPRQYQQIKDRLVELGIEAADHV